MPRTREQDRIYQKAYRDANREKVRARGREKMRRWVAANPEKVAAKNKRYYAENRDKECRRNTARYHADVEASRAWFREWRAAHPEATLAAAKAWVARNLEYRKALDTARRARKAGLERERIDFEVLLARQKSVCTWCMKRLALRDASLDHIVPIVLGAEGGASHKYENVQLLHLKCNASKGARFGSGVQPYLALVAS